MRCLDIGAGYSPFHMSDPKWEHLDARQVDHIEHIADQRDLPFDDETFDILRSSHTIEHEWWDETVDMLKEWRRVLKPDGWIHIICPNLLRMAKQIVDNPAEIDAVLPGIYGRKDFVDFGPSIYNAHRTGFSPDSLKRNCEEAGFGTVLIVDNPDHCEVVAFQTRLWHDLFRCTFNLTPYGELNGEYQGKWIMVYEARGRGDRVEALGVCHALKTLGAAMVIFATDDIGDNTLWRDSQDVDHIVYVKRNNEAPAVGGDPFAACLLTRCDTVIDLHKLIYVRTEENRIESYLSQLGVDTSQLSDDVLSGHIEVGGHVEWAYEQLIKEYGLKTGEYVVCHFQSASEEKTLGNKQANEIIKSLNRAGETPVVIGNDCRYEAKNVNLSGFPPGIPLDLNVKLIERCKRVVCIDSVFYHVARALNKEIELVNRYGLTP